MAKPHLALLDPNAGDAEIDDFLAALGVKPAEREGALGIRLAERAAQSDDDNHYYGAWIGGTKAQGGHPATSSSGGAASKGHDLADAKTVDAVASYVRDKYGYGDFTGIRPEDLGTLKDSVAEIDRLAGLYPGVLKARDETPTWGAPWKFTGIGTTSSADCPRNVKELMGDAWGATKGLSAQGVRIWINVADPAGFKEGSGILGDIGYTVAKGPVEAMTHEFGHVVHEMDRHALQSVAFAISDVYYGTTNGVPTFAKPRRQLGRDTSMYAMSSPEEGFAELFTIFNAPGKLGERSGAAQARLRRVQKLVNSSDRTGKVL